MGLFPTTNRGKWRRSTPQAFVVRDLGFFQLSSLSSHYSPEYLDARPRTSSSIITIPSLPAMSESTPPPNALGNGNVPASKANVLAKAFAHVDLDGHDLPPSPAPSSPRNGRRYALATELVYTEGSDQYNASSVPIYQVR
jgi:hypothetical protein